MRQVDSGSVYDFLAGLVAARHADGLGAMVGLLASGASRLASLRSTSILSLRQFVSGVVDYVPVQARGSGWNLKTGIAFGEHDDRNQQQALEQPASQHAAIREHADRRFSGEALWRAGERWTDGGLELFPSRRPFHQQARRFGPLILWPTINGFGNGDNFGHYFDCVVSGGFVLVVVCQKGL
jgi:hypothetical protein